MVEFLFWLSAGFVAFSYVGYPLLVAAWARFARRSVKKGPHQPSVSVVLVVRNGGSLIGEKLRNLQGLDYPADRMEIIVVSDGSTDGTVEVAKRTGDARVRVRELPSPCGKATALNVGVAEARGEILVFTDARQWLEPDAVLRLVENFCDARVGAVSGQLAFSRRGEARVGYGLSLFNRYEHWIRSNESRAHSMVGATGALYAIRRELFRELPEELILDDMYTPLQIVMRGYRCVLEESALAVDSRDNRSEFRRKLRTLTGNYQLLTLLPGLLLPSNPIFLQYWCHKLSRLLVPFFLLSLFGASLALGGGWYQLALAAQVLFYLTALSSRHLQRFPGLAPVANAGYAFVMANCAAFLCVIFFLRRKKDLWV